MNLIEEAFAPLRDLPCWNVQIGFASWLKLDFGEPWIDTWEYPERITPGGKRRPPRRSVFVRGQWHLSTIYCEWIVFDQNSRIGGSESPERLKERAARFLNGQKLISVLVEPHFGATTFLFDLGGKLVTRAYLSRRGLRVTPPDHHDQWTLFEPSGDVLVYRNDRAFSRHPGNTAMDEAMYQPLFSGASQDTVAF